MHARILLPALTAALLLTACGSAKDANKGNFSKAIDAGLTKQCIAIGFDMNIAARPVGDTPYPVAVESTRPGPMTSTEEAKQMTDRAFGQYEALTKAGLLTVQEGQVKPMFGSTTVPGKIYSLTDDGKKALKDPKYTSFCAGHYKVDEVVNFTEPGNAMGATLSEVNYTFSPADVPAWATSDAAKAAFPDLAKALATGQQGHTTLVLRNDGWSMDASGF